MNTKEDIPKRITKEEALKGTKLNMFAIGGNSTAKIRRKEEKMKFHITYLLLKIPSLNKLSFIDLILKVLKFCVKAITKNAAVLASSIPLLLRITTKDTTLKITITKAIDPMNMRCSLERIPSDFFLGGFLKTFL